jgi:DNA polymerase-1
MESTVAQAKEKGYVSTIFNRRRAMPELSSRNYAMRSFGERAAMNMPIQGTAADIIKIAMVRCSARLKKEGLESRLILQVHDELLLEVKKSERDTVRALLKEEMEGAAELTVPLAVEIHEGASWYDAK